MRLRKKIEPIPIDHVAEVKRRRTECRISAPRPPRIIIGDRMMVSIEDAVIIRDNLTAVLKEVGR